MLSFKDWIISTFSNCFNLVLELGCFATISHADVIPLLAIIVNTFICGLVFIFAPQFITAFYGADMHHASVLLRTFCFGSIIAVPHMLIGYPLLGAMGYTKEVNASVIISSIAHVTGLLALFLTGKMTIYTISYLAVLTEYFVFVLRAYWVWKYKLLSKEDLT